MMRLMKRRVLGRVLRVQVAQALLAHGGLVVGGQGRALDVLLEAQEKAHLLACKSVLRRSL